MAKRQITSLCVFCGSNPGARPEYATAARVLGATLAAEGITVIYGGGNVGMMGELANSVLEHGGQVTGIIPSALIEREAAHAGVSNLIVVGSMHERKAQMSALADGFLMLPGGLGTLEEFFEVLTWAYLGIHSKPCGLLNVDGYFNQLEAFLDHAMQEQFVLPEYRAMVLVETDHGRLLEQMRNYEPPPVEKWISRT